MPESEIVPPTGGVRIFPPGVIPVSFLRRFLGRIIITIQKAIT